MCVILHAIEQGNVWEAGGADRVKNSHRNLLNASAEVHIDIESIKVPTENCEMREMSTKKCRLPNEINGLAKGRETREDKQ